MHNSGELDEYGKDEDIAALLVSGTPESVELAIQQLQKRRGRNIWGILSKYPGLRREDIEELYCWGLHVLAARSLNGKFKAARSGAGALALWARIVELDACDLLRKKTRRIRDAFGPLDDDCHYYDDSVDFDDLVLAIEGHLRDMHRDQQIVMRTYVEMVCDGHARRTGLLPPGLFTENVNQSLRRVTLTEIEVHSLLMKGLSELWPLDPFGTDSNDVKLVGLTRVVLQSYRRLALEEPSRRAGSQSHRRPEGSVPQPEGLAVQADPPSSRTLTENVNISLSQVSLSDGEVGSLFRSGRETLRQFLQDKGFQP